MSPIFGKKGLETEELLRAYFVRSGFFVIRSIRLRYGQSELTDIDLWVYERSATFARRRTIIDIKDKQKPQAAERLFFVSGLAKIIGVEGAGVATTDKNSKLRDLAKKHKILWIDGDDLQRLKKSDQLELSVRLSDEQLFVKIDELDKLRGGKKIRNLVDDMKSSVGDRFGISSANTAIEGFRIFADQTIKSHPNSPAAELLTRLAFFAAALTAAALDFASADTALRPKDERLKVMTNAIRFGGDFDSTFQKLEWAEKALHEYINNGSNIAKGIRSRFLADAAALPAEDLAEVAIKMSNTNKLFEIARSLESAAFQSTFTGFDALNSDAKGYIGSLLDFCSFERIKFANAALSASSEQSQVRVKIVLNDETEAVKRSGQDDLL